MEYLQGSGLVDHQHLNVVVVVTKSLSFWNDYEDFDPVNMNKQWQHDANVKTRIIDNLRSEIFPSSFSWPVVFIENGGGNRILQEYKRLPNGELSHQNLFDAIYRILGGTSDEDRDLVGFRALRLLTGDESIVPALTSTPAETLLELDSISGRIGSVSLVLMTYSVIPKSFCRHSNTQIMMTLVVAHLLPIMTQYVTSVRLQRHVSGFATTLF
jgi:hypothetical protein